MTDVLLGIIATIILIQWHHKEKHTGWYGKINVLITKRFKRYIRKYINIAIIKIGGVIDAVSVQLRKAWRVRG